MTGYGGGIQVFCENSNISTSANLASIYTTNPASEIFTQGLGSSIHTSNDYSGISTQGTSSDIFAYYSNVYSVEGSIYSVNGSVFSNNGNVYADIGDVYSTHGNLYTTNGDIFTLNGKIGVGTSEPQYVLDVADPTIAIRGNRAPASAAATGVQGEICFDSNYMYRCVATNTWKRSPLTTWT